MAIARRNEHRYSGKTTAAYINLYSIYKRPKDTILRQWLDTPTAANFSGLTVPIVGCTALNISNYDAIICKEKRIILADLLFAFAMLS